MTGEQIGSWILDRELGKGGMGIVYLAHHVDSSKQPNQAAIKVLALEHAMDESIHERFQREIAVLGRLKHANIVRLLDYGEEKGRAFYAMEYVDGVSFQTLLNQHQRLPWDEVLDMAMQVCQALKHAHNHGIVHRDLKPSNLLRSNDDSRVVKLTDFGVAWVFAEPHLTKPGTVVGTAEHISPEQAAGKQPTKKSDIYSLGTVMYTLLTGRPPFQGEVLDLLHKHRYAQFDRPQKIATDLPYDLDQIVCQMMEKDPDKRPPDANALYRRLDVLKRKYKRKAAQRTSHGESSSETAVTEHADSSQAGPATLMADLMREELHRQNRGGPIKQFFNHPLILILLFALTLGAIVWTFWPESQNSLYRQAEKLMASSDADDWYEAEKLLDKLDENYPDHPYKAEIQPFREKIEADRRLRRARRSARLNPDKSEAQWFFEKAIRLRQQGQNEKAKQVWQTLIDVFREVKEEQIWVRLAEEELRVPSKRARRGEERWSAVRKVLQRIKELEKQDKKEESEKLRRSLELLYADDPSAKKLLQE